MDHKTERNHNNNIEVREAIGRDAALSGEDAYITVFNPLGVDRGGIAYLNAAIGQPIIDVCGRERYAADLGIIPAFGAVSVEVRDLPVDLSLKFDYSEDLRTAHTRFVTVRFDENGFIASLFDAIADRELRRIDGEPLNALHLYDKETDAELPIKLVDRRVSACGAFEMRIRSEYALGEGSTLTQDIIFDASSTKLDFHTCIVWKEPSARLTASFDLALTDVSVKQGDPSWTDISESDYGIAIMNNADRDVAVSGTTLCLTLHDGDPIGDGAIVELTYSLLMHQGGFSKESVVHPAYCLAHPFIERRGKLCDGEDC